MKTNLQRKPLSDFKAPAWLACAVALILAPLGLEAGTITGSVRAEARAGTELEGGSGKYDSRQFKFAERVNYAEMRDFIVYIDNLIQTNSPPEQAARVDTRKISQKGALFTPHVLPVLVGTTVEWPNHDDILHNVFSFSEPKPFDLGLYKNPEIKRVIFDKPGRVDVYCSIHARMSCIVLVLQNPYFAAANDRGLYKIADVPAGRYQLKAWHERLPSVTREVLVPETGELKVDFILGVKNLPPP